MRRPPVIPAEKKARIVMSVIAGEFSVAEAERREKVSEQSIGRWEGQLFRSRETARWPGSPVHPRGRSSWRPRLWT